MIPMFKAQCEQLGHYCKVMYRKPAFPQDAPTNCVKQHLPFIHDITSVIPDLINKIWESLTCFFENFPEKCNWSFTSTERGSFCHLNSRCVPAIHLKDLKVLKQTIKNIAITVIHNWPSRVLVHVHPKPCISFFIFLLQKGQFAKPTEGKLKGTIVE